MRAGAGVEAGGFLSTFLTLTRWSRFGAGIFFFTMSKTSGVHGVGCDHTQTVTGNRLVEASRGVLE